MQPLAPNAVDNADRNPLGNFILSGGLGGQAIASKPPKSIYSGQRKKTLLEALQDEVAGIIDLSNINVQPFNRDPAIYPYPTLKNIHEIVMDIETSIVDRVIANQNGTPCDGYNLSGEQKQMLFKGLQTVLEHARTGEVPVLGITVDPSGNKFDRPAGNPAASVL